MTRPILNTSIIVLLALAKAAAQQVPDVILSNAKIITVDERFTIAQAVAIKGDRILAVGTNQDIARRWRGRRRGGWT